jgi:hypothetical protein
MVAATKIKTSKLFNFLSDDQSRNANGSPLPVVEGVLSGVKEITGVDVPRLNVPIVGKSLDDIVNTRQNVGDAAAVVEESGKHAGDDGMAITRNQVGV